LGKRGKPPLCRNCVFRLDGISQNTNLCLQRILLWSLRALDISFYKLNSSFDDTITIDSSIFESSQREGFAEECFRVLNEFTYIQQLLLVDDAERVEILEHKMATVTLYKDLFRVQLDKLLQTLLSKEINKLPDGENKDLLVDVNLENITSFLENDIYLDGTSISNELKNIILNILKKVNFIVANWEFITSQSEEFETYGIDSVQDEIEFMLTDNISTFLGENIKLAETFLEESAKSGKFNNEELLNLNSLIKENGFRKIEFGYDLDFEKIKYLIYSAIRCKNQIANEREDVELFNLLAVLLTSFKSNPGTLRIIEDVRVLYKDKPEIIKHLASLTKVEIKPKLIIENSPPIYSNVQHNLMYRIYECTDGGVKVHIYSVPYNRLETEESIDSYKGQAEELISFPTTGNQVENTILSTLIATDLPLEEAIKLHPTLSRIGLETITNNDSVLDPIIGDLMDGFKPFVSKVVKKLPQIISDPVIRSQFVKSYEDTIKAIDLHLKDKSKIKTTLSESDVEAIQEQVLDKVMSGQSLETAINDIVGEKSYEIKSESDGDCVRFETEVKSEKGEATNEDFSKYQNGTVLSTKSVEGNGFKSEIIEMVVEGKKINMVKCLVCQKQFDTCNEECPECNTSRAKQYDAIYKGKTKEGKAAIKEINSRIEERQAEAKQQLDNDLVKDVTKPIDPGIGGAIAGAFSNFLGFVSGGVFAEPEKNYFEG